ncbi:MAG: hypothetical protein V1799_18830 [bacterium]
MKRSVITLVLGLLLFQSGYSLPRFASRTGYSCQSCHVNPTGGGMRTPFGVSYGQEDLISKSTAEASGLQGFSPKLSDFFSYGVDFRFLAFYQTKNNPDASRSSFFPMQADVYLNLTVSKKVNLYINPAFGQANRYEVFGIAKIIEGGYLKVGRFTPSYGLRYDDHTSAIREATPFRNNEGQQVGIEAGYATGPFSLTGAVTNGVSGDRDTDMAKAVLGRADARFNIAGTNVSLGVSHYNDIAGAEKINLLGGFGSITMFDRLTLIADVERIQGNAALMSLNAERKQRNTNGASLKQLAFMIEVDYLLTPGLDLKFVYDFFDPDTEYRTGYISRYSGGVEFMPLSGMEVRPMVRYTKDNVLDKNTTDVQILFHLFI